MLCRCCLFLRDSKQCHFCFTAASGVFMFFAQKEQNPSSRNRLDKARVKFVKRMNRLGQE